MVCSFFNYGCVVYKNTVALFACLSVRCDHLEAQLERKQQEADLVRQRLQQLQDHYDAHCAEFEQRLDLAREKERQLITVRGAGPPAVAAANVAVAARVFLIIPMGCIFVHCAVLCCVVLVVLLYRLDVPFYCPFSPMHICTFMCVHLTCASHLSVSACLSVRAGVEA
jgi:hypothetical protein